MEDAAKLEQTFGPLLDNRRMTGDEISNVTNADPQPLLFNLNDIGANDSDEEQESIDSDEELLSTETLANLDDTLYKATDAAAGVSGIAQSFIPPDDRNILERHPVRWYALYIVVSIGLIVLVFMITDTWHYGVALTVALGIVGAGLLYTQVYPQYGKNKKRELGKNTLNAVGL